MPSLSADFLVTRAMKFHLLFSLFAIFNVELMKLERIRVSSEISFDHTRCRFSMPFNICILNLQINEICSRAFLDDLNNRQVMVLREISISKILPAGELCYLRSRYIDAIEPQNFAHYHPAYIGNVIRRSFDSNANQFAYEFGD